MRCISPHSRYSIQVIEGQEQVMMDARGFASTIVNRNPVIANFQQSGLHEWEIEAALDHFNFSGIPEGINPLTRIAVFDSEAYVFALEWQDEDEHGNSKERDEFQARIDKQLKKLQTRHPSEFIIVEKPASAKPWPTYDTDSIEDILAFQKRLGISAESIRLYEHEHEGRPEVIRTMAAIEAGLDPDQALQEAVPAREFVGSLGGKVIEA